MDNIKWSKELVIEKIIESNNKGIKLNSGSIRKTDIKLFTSARRYFGSWKNAVQSAGINYVGDIPNKISVVGDTKEVIVTKRNGSKLTVIIDNHVNLPSSVCVGGGYPRVCVDGKQILLHRYVFGDISKGNQIDHVDRNPLNCKLSNLREVTPSQNLQNTKYKGCYFHKRSKKWVVRLTIDGKRKEIGRFDAEQDAIECYLESKLIHHKEFSPVYVIKELDKIGGRG